MAQQRIANDKTPVRGAVRLGAVLGTGWKPVSRGRRCRGEVVETWFFIASAIEARDSAFRS